ncbi:unnamed protein product, partial [Rotaria magnacalcarata]
MAQLQEEISR